MNKVLVLDPAKCTGCRSCEVACSTVKTGEANPYASRIRTVLFQDEGFFYPNVCLQCETPYCALPCPTRALWKDRETGLVEFAEERCVGCKLCLVACPFGAISMVETVSAKCDLCAGDPICVKFCQFGALSYGEPDEISLGKRVVVAGQMKQAYLEQARAG
ncbi:MAG TPA: 4Fe-4S dicluster domain-containing protein [Anaerolineae bacterium]|nr:4Fe-4S dicluster domain-containing protein [Anaerolineae bacterium]